MEESVRVLVEKDRIVDVITELHQAGNFRVTVHDDTADAFCYGMASHYLPNPSGRNTRVFVGSYDFGLRRQDARWRIDRFRFNLKYVDGNLELEKSV